MAFAPNISYRMPCVEVVKVKRTNRGRNGTLTFTRYEFGLDFVSFNVKLDLDRSTLLAILPGETPDIGWKVRIGQLKPDGAVDFYHDAFKGEHFDTAEAAWIRASSIWEPQE